MQRLAFVTGGARGIGAAICAELELRGCRVVAPSRSELDLAQPASVDAYLDRNAGLEVDILVNNAGMGVLKEIADIDAETWQTMLQVNLTSALRLVQCFGPGMARRRWGRILCVSSILGAVARERRAAYSMTKSALDALTRSAAVEFGPAGVLANALAPGYVDTDLTRQNNSPQVLADLEAEIPLRRLAAPAELARVAAFLVSEENTYLTGQVIYVDGGFTCQ